jgi:hypothetical protein
VTPVALGWPVTPDESIAGQPVWHRSLGEEDKSAAPTLSAIIEDRFLVTARRPLLIESLASHGNRHRLLLPFGETSGVDWTAGSLVFCKPRPDAPGHLGEGRKTCAIFVATEKPWRVEGWYLDGKVRKDDGLPERVSERRAGNYLVKSWDLEVPEHPSADDVDQARNGIALMLAVAYGLRISF